MDTRPLTGTYRVQLHEAFPLGKAREVVGYLDRLGVTHLYASPILTARPGSTHGYDVADPAQVNPELGGDEARRALVASLREHGMGMVLDIVPNHMGIGPANPYWEDVLANGRDSKWAHLFDIDWNAPAPGLRGKVMLPVLGEELEAILAKGELAVKREPGKPPRLAYFENTFPLSPTSHALIPDGDRPDADAMRRLLDAQHYLLAFWRRAGKEINYRRFFDVNELAAVRAEDPEVFALTHGLPLAWVEAGELDGLRIDHVDGLLDPVAYLATLREECERRAGGGQQGTASFPVFVEKILSPGEHLRPDWPIQGTTGYEFLNDLEAVFIDDVGAERVEQAYRRLLRLRPGGVTFHEVAMRGKVKILRGPLAADVERLVRLLAPVARRDPRGAGIGRRALSEAVTSLLVTMPVYRTYVDGRGEPTADDVALVERALERACDRGTAKPEVLTLVADVLLLRDRGTRNDEERESRLAFVQRFQQTSGPATAKGIEDTALYLYFPLGSRNEVGGEPDRELRDAVEAFHRGAAERAARWPVTLLCTNTHDTKRSADVRARLDVLSEIPEEWTTFVTRARRAAAALRRKADGRVYPDANTEYLFLQSLLGVWPLGVDGVPGADVLKGLADRVHAYLLKATREGKTMTSWTEPNAAFEEALEGYVRGALDPSTGERLLAEVARFAGRIARPGLWNALSRVALHFTTPGTPDLYQGDELWNFALVDPDNRRPVDYAARDRVLARVEQAAPGEARGALWREAIAAPDDGVAKLLLTHALLQARRAHPALFREGGHEAVRASGALAPHVVAFARQAGEAAALVVATRLPLGVAGDGAPPVGAAWGDTALELPAELAGRRWRCAITGREVGTFAGGRASCAGLLADAPVAVLVSADA